MVEVFRIQVDANTCRSLAISDRAFSKNGGMVFNGKERGNDWNPPTFWIYNPLLGDSDFLDVASGCFAFHERLTDNPRVMECLEISGEILPITLESGETYYILNVTACVNSLDHAKCVFGRYWDMNSQSIKQGGLELYAFHPDRISSSPIFKVPETAQAHMLTSRNTGCLICSDDFMTVYEEEGLTGLRFEKIWEEENPD